MTGLLRNNIYASRSNVKVFSYVMLLSGIFVTVMDNKITTLLIGYALLSMVGFPTIAIASLRKENASKWGKYKLTAPIKRMDIVKSYFISQLLWFLLGFLFAAVFVSLSLLFHGFPFDKSTDVLMLFIAGTSISLFMSAIFFPLFYIGGDERSEAFLVLSLLCGIGLLMGLTSFINWLFGPNQTLLQLLTGCAIILLCSSIVFILSYPLTVCIFRRKEY